MLRQIQQIAAMQVRKMNPKNLSVQAVVRTEFGRWLIVALAAIFLAACSSKEIDLDVEPVELVKFKPAFKVRKAWSKGVGDSSEFLRLALRPSTDGTLVYAAAHDGKIVALNAETGKRIWGENTKLPLSAGPGTDGKLVVAGSNDGDVVALDAATGEERWRVRVTSEVLAVPAVADDKVLLRTVNGKLSALAAIDGTQVWSIQQSMPKLSVRGVSSPIIARGMVISGFDNGRVAAFNLADGGVVWDVLLEPPSGRTEVERLVDINSDVQAAGPDVYAVGYQGRLGSIAIESGQLLWSQELSSHSGLCVDSNNIYVTDQKSEIVALSRGSGREIWRSKVVRNRDATAPIAYAGSIVVGDFEGYVHFLDAATGDLQARVKAGGKRITSQPLVVNDLLYVMNDGGGLVAFRSPKPAQGE
jgi:outer membrane protein assembly factor BamB